VSKSISTKSTLIYWLFDIRPETLSFWPEGRPFYCGKTIRTAKYRLHQHKWQAQHRPDREHSKRLLECGEHVDIRVVETVPPDGSWIKRERHWIAYLRSLFPGVTNIADGGEGEGRPSLGLQIFMMRMSPEMIKRIKCHNKNVSAFAREAIAEELLRLEKKSKKEKD
jgi:hypothetical protein